MPKVKYSSDEDTFDRRQTPRGVFSSGSSESPPKERARKTARKAKKQATETLRDSESFVEQHKSQIALAAAVAGGLAVASFVVSKVLGNKRSQAKKAEEGKAVGTQGPSQTPAAQPRKLAARRKRSG